MPAEQTTENLVNLLISAAEEGTIDGFFLPFDVPCPTTETLSVYKHPKGRLFFNPKSWPLYGYEHESDFASDVRKSQVFRKTPMGAVSLGMAASKAIHPRNLTEWVAGTARILIPSESKEEERAVCSFIHSTLDPHAKLITSSNLVKSTLANSVFKTCPAPWSAWKTLPAHLQQEIRATTMIGLGAVTVGIVGVFTTPLPIMPVAGLWFLLAFLRLSSLLSNPKTGVSR